MLYAELNVRLSAGKRFDTVKMMLISYFMLHVEHQAFKRKLPFPSINSSGSLSPCCGFASWFLSKQKNALLALLSRRGFFVRVLLETCSVIVTLKGLNNSTRTARQFVSPRLCPRHPPTRLQLALPHTLRTSWSYF